MRGEEIFSLLMLFCYLFIYFFGLLLGLLLSLLYTDESSAKSS